MASKLSEQEKQQVAELYCQPGSTTATLANQFGVSSSTISRVLKQQLSAEDYAAVTQWKRTGEKEPLELSFSVSDNNQPDGAPIASSVESTAPESAAITTSEVAAQSVTETSDGDEVTEFVAVDEVLPEPVEEAVADDEAEEAVADDEADELIEALETPAAPKRSTPAAPIKRRSRRRSSSQNAAVEDSVVEQPSRPLKTVKEVAVSSTDSEDLEDDLTSASETDDLDGSDIAAQWDTDDLEDADDYDDDDYDDEDEDELDEDEDSDDWEDGLDTPEFHTPRREQLEILPFADLVLQKPCYLVVDRLSELITCPLKEFAELGLIPEDEAQARTLPVFDNHRVARRFSRRNQRIIKVPNGVMLTKTQPYLSAKGITRLLFDGQVYALN